MAMSEQSTPGQSLKPRELEIVRYMAEGLTNREIAERLYIGVETVRTYAKQIYAKLNVSGRVQAGKKAQALGLFAESREDQFALYTDMHKLPPQLNPFIGRKQELRDISELLTRPEVRLLTILAPGGMGKTRIAIEAATQQIGNYQDGIFFIPLQKLTDVDNIALAIAEVLNLKFQQDERDPKQQLLDYLSRKKMLLVMDNWDHLLSSASLVLDILKAAPGIKILATSREKLNLSIENVYLLGGMQFPSLENLADALEYDAVQLLEQSARRVKLDWTVTEENLDTVVRVCRLTVGMPLGILLGVSWLDVLSLEEIADEIQKNLDFLETDLQDVPERQRSIRAVFERTWQYLNLEERETFMKLSVFRGGFTRSSAQTITATSLRSLHRLVDKALLSQTDDDRYEIHELLRQYGGLKLEGTDQMDAVHHAHSIYYLDFLSKREADIKGRRQISAIEEIEADFENVRVAWDWANRQQHFTEIDEASESLMWFCEIRARFIEGQNLFQQALAQLPDSQDYDIIRSRLIIRRYRLIEHPELDDLLESALKIAKGHENWSDVAMGLLVYGRSNWIRRKEYHEALNYFERAYHHYRAIGDEFYISSVVNRIGLCHFLLRNTEEGIRLTQQSADMQRQIGDYYGLGITLNNLGTFNYLLDKYDQSIDILRENIGLGKQSKNIGNLAFSYGTLSLALFSSGEFSEARDLATRASTMGRNVGYVQSESLGVCALGLLASIVDEEYEIGFEISTQGLHLANMSNVSIEPFAHSGIALASCGLGRMEEVQAQLQQLAVRSAIRRTYVHLGLFAAIWSVYCYEREAYQKSTRHLSFVLNGGYKTFGWAKKWPLMQRIKEDLQTSLTEESFNTIWEEGRRMSADSTLTLILRDIG
jgi:predicted ATPase/DNA-binding CsgD family transcriptional regulator